MHVQPHTRLVWVHTAVNMSFPRGFTRPRATWKYKHMLKRMTVPGQSIPEEESEDTDGTETDSMEDSSELAPVLMSSDCCIMSPGPSTARTWFYGKARKTKDRGAFYKGWKGDINGLAKKLQLLAEEFFAGNTTARNEFVHVLDALLRLKQVTRKQYTNITARLAVWLYTRIDVLQWGGIRIGGSGIVSMIGSLLARYATKAMMTTAAKAALKGSLKAATRAVPHYCRCCQEMEKSRYKREIQSRASVEESFCGYRTWYKLSNRRIWYCIGLKMIGESILELHETNATDESIKSYEYNEYQPITGTQLNSAGQITITIENQDQFLHLQNSYLLIEGELLKADNTRYADAGLITLTNNGLLYLFSSLKLTLAGQEVEHVNYPGHDTSLLGFLVCRYQHCCSSC